MKKIIFLPLIFLLLIVIFFYHSFLLKGELPIPSDTIVGLYHPFRDLYAKTYPNGIPYKNFLITDPVRQQYPWRWLVISLEKIGQLPLWNPYSFAGAPLLANFQSAAFYPLNILLFIFPFSIGWSLLILCGQILGGIFMYWYLSHLRLNKYACFLGSLVFIFCGFTTAWLEWGTLDQIAIWLPLILLSIDKIFLFSLKGKKVKQSLSNIKKHSESASVIPQDASWVRNDVRVWSIIFVLSLIFAFFAGHLQTFFYLGLIILFYFVARWIQFGKSRNYFSLFLLLSLCFLLLTAIQWIPTLQFVLLSARNADQLNAWQQPGWFIPWQNLIQFIAPDFFGNPTTLNYWGIWNYAEFIGYIGIFPLIMALFALFYRHDKKTLFFGSFFFLSLIFSLPTIFAQLPYIYNFPFLDTSQPTRLLFIADFSLSILCALGLDYYLFGENKKKVFYPLLFILIIFLGLWYFVLSGYKFLHITYDLISVSKHNLYFPTILFVFIALFIAGITLIKQKRIKIIFILILLVISVIDLLRFSDKFIPFTSQAYLFPSDPALTYLQKQSGQFRIMTTDSEMLPPNFSVMYHLQSLDGYDPLYLQRYGELIIAIGREKPNIQPPFGFNRIITPNNFNSRLIDLLGVKYILSLSDLHTSKLVKVFTEGQTRIYRNNDAYSRAFLVSDIKAISTKQESINALFDPTVNLHTTAVVEGWDNNNEKLSTGSAVITNYQDNSVTINVQTSGDAFLVLTDTYYPTWHVLIDGKEGKIYRTDYNFRGVLIPNGKHNVIFYDSLL